MILMIIILTLKCIKSQPVAWSCDQDKCTRNCNNDCTPDGYHQEWVCTDSRDECIFNCNTEYSCQNVTIYAATGYVQLNCNAPNACTGMSIFCGTAPDYFTDNNPGFDASNFDGKVDLCQININDDNAFPDGSINCNGHSSDYLSHCQLNINNNKNDIGSSMMGTSTTCGSFVSTCTKNCAAGQICDLSSEICDAQLCQTITASPTLSPTSESTTPSPTTSPSYDPTISPTSVPSFVPTMEPTTTSQSILQSSEPTINPTLVPSLDPTMEPTTPSPATTMALPTTSTPTTAIPRTRYPTTMEPTTAFSTTVTPTTTSPTISSTTMWPSYDPTINPTFMPSIQPTTLMTSTSTPSSSPANLPSSSLVASGQNTPTSSPTKPPQDVDASAEIGVNQANPNTTAFEQKHSKDDITLIILLSIMIGFVMVFCIGCYYYSKLRESRKEEQIVNIITNGSNNKNEKIEMEKTTVPKQMTITLTPPGFIKQLSLKKYESMEEDEESKICNDEFKPEGFAIITIPPTDSNMDGVKIDHLKMQSTASELYDNTNYEQEYQTTQGNENEDDNGDTITSGNDKGNV